MWYATNRTWLHACSYLFLSTLFPQSWGSSCSLAHLALMTLSAWRRSLMNKNVKSNNRMRPSWKAWGGMRAQAVLMHLFSRKSLPLSFVEVWNMKLIKCVVVSSSSLTKSYMLFLHPPSGTLSSDYGRQRRATERKLLCSSWGWWKVPWRNLCWKLQMTGRSVCKTRCMYYKVRYNYFNINAFGLCFSVISQGQTEEERDHVFSDTGLKLETPKVRKWSSIRYF